MNFNGLGCKSGPFLIMIKGTLTIDSVNSYSYPKLVQWKCFPFRIYGAPWLCWEDKTRYHLKGGYCVGPVDSLYFFLLCMEPRVEVEWFMGRTAVDYGNGLLAEKLSFNGESIPWKRCHDLGWELLILPCGVLYWIWLLESSFVLSFYYVWCAIASSCLLLVVSWWQQQSIGYCCQAQTLD